MLDEFAADVAGVEVGKDQDIGTAGDAAFEQFARGNFGINAASTWSSPSKSASIILSDAFFNGQGGGGLDAADGWVSGAAFGRVREEGDAGTSAEELAGELGGGDGDIGELLDIGFRDDAAIGHEHDAVLAETAVFDFHDHATRGGLACGERP
jgi:hypothetical protein